MKVDVEYKDGRKGIVNMPDNSIWNKIMNHKYTLNFVIFLSFCLIAIFGTFSFIASIFRRR
jgi:hypothetical protein